MGKVRNFDLSKNPSPEKQLLLEWLAAKQHVAELELALRDAQELEVPLRVRVQNLVLQRSLLTIRQRQVCDMIIQGKQNKEIANELNISTRTVKFHVSALLSKLGRQNRHEIEGIDLNRVMTEVKENGGKK